MGASKSASKRAREQEEWLRAETAAAWARIRQACYQLRLFNLHDFAKGIAEGAFDLAPEGVPGACDSVNLAESLSAEAVPKDASRSLDNGIHMSRRHVHSKLKDLPYQ